MEVDEKYMRRALQLAANGRGFTSPNPMVGAVIVADGHIIGEGWHRRCGGPHAEVNAVNSVHDKELLRRSTMYVTLEPCSHYGKTPPCADMIVNMGIPRVVIGSLDPNEKVSGRGVRKLLDAGVEVVSGVLEDQCKALNVKFMTAHTLRRPYVMLKWACSSDGFLDCERLPSVPPPRFSTPVSMSIMHRLRSEFDAILVGSETVIRDNPSLTVRLYPGHSPRPVVLDRRARIDAGYTLGENPATLFVRDEQAASIDQLLQVLFSQGITSVMVEGGASVISSFLSSGLWDCARIEISPVILGQSGRAHLSIPEGTMSITKLGPNTILTITNSAIRK